jgi:TRAP-type mannitol/chloroaromatic compound transport system permease small subunit
MAGPSGHASAPRPGASEPLLARLDWWYAKLEDALNLVAALAIFGVMVLGVVQILSRSVSGGLHKLLPAIPPVAIHGYIDYIQFIAVLYAILGLAYCQRLGGHIRMEIVLGTMRGRLLWLTEALAVLLALGVTLLLIAGTWDNFYNAWSKGDSSMDIRLPQWPSKLVVPLMLGVLVPRLLLQLWGYGRLARDPGRGPVAVPRLETVEEHARHEIEEALGKVEAGKPAGERRAQ